MGWWLLILGVVLWALAHLFKRIAPGPRARLGDKARILVTLDLVAAIVLMVLGFRMTAYVAVWTPPAFMVHVNNLLVLVAIWMMSPAGAKGRLLNGFRHPMLTGFALWAVAHLLVNGDLAAIVLFGGLLVWALAEMAVINRAEPGWQPGEPGTLGKDAMFMAASVLLLAVIGYIHGLVGPSPFPM
ncbi:NnrU family protein [Pukyongiella litopenaei]|uniref:NnrU domain-containing protein n=1 Tax=Pukyongiella litopenaei TaxID=2605946 RepID=A0A2S0MQ96_9RHOB|nr:NnrU family protein [Pukyongiella litopenaei]AVO38044.1 hypothetical protein C6Y53_10245 [Pukyongiella litopenaei]